ncbi:MAG: hypothetical protein MN733_10205 [Nitrososphaera sp.]|nr:hypothetical protein [Nitrososphaera sp.]
MNSFPPNDLKKLKVRISAYERALSGGDRDGAGKRYLLGPMYLLLGDVEGALKHFEWFDKTYADVAVNPISIFAGPWLGVYSLWFGLQLCSQLQPQVSIDVRYYQRSHQGSLRR